MNKNNYLLILFIVLILAAIFIGGVLMMRGDQKPIEPAVDIDAIQPPDQEQVLQDEPQNNEESYPVHFLEGEILSIQKGEYPVFEIDVDLSKLFSKETSEKMIRTIVTTQDTEYILHNLDTEKNSSFDPSTLKIGEYIIFGIQESNLEIRSLDKFTANKLVRMVSE